MRANLAGQIPDLFRVGLKLGRHSDERSIWQHAPHAWRTGQEPQILRFLMQPEREFSQTAHGIIGGCAESPATF